MSTIAISIDKDVRDRLKRFVTKGETYSSTIERLLDSYEEYNLELYVEGQYEKLKKDREKFISLEEYEAQRR